MKIYSIDLVPEFGEYVIAKEGRNSDSVGWIAVDETLVLNCCCYFMEFTDTVIYNNCESTELKNTFSASILRNDFIKFHELESDPIKLIARLRRDMDIKYASAILSNLVSDVFAYSRRITDTI